MRIPASGLADLSPRRRRIICEILPAVVPSTYGSARFREIDANYKPGAGYTPCGGLPALVARHLGVTLQQRKEGMGGYGLVGLRNGAIRRGAWVHAGDCPGNAAVASAPLGTRPKPGDLYVLCSGSGHAFGCCTLQRETKEDPMPRHLGAAVEHVGVIVDADNEALWITADAGQGAGVQYADYVLRQYDGTTGFMTGEASRAGKPMRRLCGWVDVDRYPFGDGFGTA